VSTSEQARPPLPPFTLETATVKVQKAEDAWNSCDADRVALAYTEDSVWRNRADFFSGRPMIREFLKRKWARELDYRLKKELWAFTDNRISVRFDQRHAHQSCRAKVPLAATRGTLNCQFFCLKPQGEAP
jgi:nuclear transport factor 2 (NTF2) superfamily protein